jgi:hypothetical protein
MSESLLDRYNAAYNLACAALPSGGPISMEHLQILALGSFFNAMDWDHVYTAESVKTQMALLIASLYKQGHNNA